MFPDAIPTPRLLLRPIRPDDAGPIFDGYTRDPEVTRFLTWRPHESLSDTHAYIAACLAQANACTYAITQAGGAVIGAFALTRPAPFRLEFGYVLARPSWGHDLMTEALTAVTAWALQQPDIWRIGGVCDVDNHGSARVMEKSGLSREALLRRWIIHPNIEPAPRDCFSYAKVR